MKHLPGILVIISFIVLSCNQSTKNDAPKPETPKALQEKNSTAELYSKSRGYDSDLVESLYSELTEKDPELQNLEKMIIELNDQKEDSAKTFNAFHNKNTQYYQSGDHHVLQIKDSILRQKIKAILDNSLSAYNNKVQHHKDLLEILLTKDAYLDDMHTALKIVKTLPVMHKYQKESFPSPKSIEGVIKRYDRTIQNTDSLIKK